MKESTPPFSTVNKWARELNVMPALKMHIVMDAYYTRNYRKSSAMLIEDFFKHIGWRIGHEELICGINDITAQCWSKLGRMDISQAASASFWNNKVDFMPRYLTTVISTI